VDLQPWIAELDAWAATHGSAPERHAYGPGPEQYGELRLPPGAGPHRVAVLLHGGFWRAAFTRSLMDALAVDLVTLGWATWNVEYRRVGNGGGVSETQEDVEAALDALADLEAPLQTTSLLLIGHSAGGQLALRAAVLPSVANVVALAGVCDLRAAAEQQLAPVPRLNSSAGHPPSDPPPSHARTCSRWRRPAHTSCSSTATPTTVCRSNRAASTSGRRTASCSSCRAAVTSS
jgi:acetyl esterase/lipase